MRDMCNLSRALVEQGAEKEKMSLTQMMIEEKEPVEKISKYTVSMLQKFAFKNVPVNFTLKEM